jgi:hypothetical protein
MKLVAAYLCKSYYIILDRLMMVCWIVCSVIDAGKSTIGGQILYLSDMVDERTIQKYEREAKDKNRESWYGHCSTETDLIVFFFLCDSAGLLQCEIVDIRCRTVWNKLDSVDVFSGIWHISWTQMRRSEPR